MYVQQNKCVQQSKSMFSPSGGQEVGLGWDYPKELQNLGLIPSHKCVSKIPWTFFLLEFQSKVSMVLSLCQSVLSNSRGKWIFVGLIHRVSPLHPLWGKTLIGALMWGALSTESSQCAQWVAKDPRFLHADSEDWQTGRMPSLIWVFAGRTLILLVLSCRGSYFK